MNSHLKLIINSLQNHLNKFEDELEMSVPSIYIRGFENFIVMHDDKHIAVEFFDKFQAYGFKLNIQSCTGNQLEFLTKLLLLISAAKNSKNIKNLSIVNHVQENIRYFPDIMNGLANFSLDFAMHNYRIRKKNRKYLG